MNLNIHVITAGASIYQVYLKIDSFYPVSKIIIIKEMTIPDHIEEEIQKVRDDCALRKKTCELIVIENQKYDLLMEQLIQLKKTHEDDSFFFNITPGRKDIAIMTFIASLWMDGIGYYWPDELESPFEFPIPKIPIRELSKNKLHVRILQELIDRKRSNQNTIRNLINKNPNTLKLLSPQTFGASIATMESYGLLSRKKEGRESIIQITMAGRLAYSMILNKK